MVRVDYMPNATALAVMEAKRSWRYPLNTNSGILDAILTEWAELSGINYAKVDKAKVFSPSPELSDAFPRAYDFGSTAAIPKLADRATCGARRHRDGQPCQAKREPGKRRCRFHGGRSTGPTSPEGKLRAKGNLRQNRQGPLTQTTDGADAYERPQRSHEAIVETDPRGIPS